MAAKLRSFLGRDQFPVDPEYALQDESWPSFLTTVGFSLTLAVIASTSWGRNSIQARVDFVWGAALVHALAYLVNVGVWRRRYASPNFWPVRMMSCMVTVAAASVYAAAAPLAASPAWVGYLLFAVFTSRHYPLNGMSIAAIAAPPLVIHWTANPAAPLLARAAAAGVVAATVGLFAAGVRLRHMERVRVDALDALARDAAHRAGTLRIAMSLHDGLSGALYAARQRASRADHLDDVLAAGRTALRRLHVALGLGIAQGDAERALDATRKLASTLGVELELRSSGDPAQLSCRHNEDLGCVLGEIVANAAAHGAMSHPLVIEVALGPRRVRVSSHLDGWTEQQQYAGRGHRNLERRARSHGGSLELVPDATGARLVVEWPLDRWHTSIRGYELAMLGAATAVSGGLVFASRTLGPALVSGVGLVFCLLWMPALGRRRERELERALQRQREAEAAPVLVLASMALAPGSARLCAALRAEHREEIALAIAELAERLGDLLWVLEWEGSDADLEADLRSLSAECGVTPVRDVEPGAAADLGARWALRHRARTGVFPAGAALGRASMPIGSIAEESTLPRTAHGSVGGGMKP